jgi:hypothetical protein
VNAAFSIPDAGSAERPRVLLVKACLASDLITAIHETLGEHRFVSPIISLEENP